MTKTFCDRCKKEVPQRNGARKYIFYKQIYIPIIYEFTYPHAKEVVLCESCIKDFESWFKI